MNDDTGKPLLKCYNNLVAHNSFLLSATGGDILANGIVDELRFDSDCHSLTLVELKTRYSNNLPCEAQKKGHRLQVRIIECVGFPYLIYMS